MLPYVRARAVYLAVIAPLLAFAAAVALRRDAPMKLAGTAGTIPVFVDSSRIGDSLVSQVGAYVVMPAMTLNGAAPVAGGAEVTSLSNSAGAPVIACNSGGVAGQVGGAWKGSWNTGNGATSCTVTFSTAPKAPQLGANSHFLAATLDWSITGNVITVTSGNLGFSTVTYDVLH